MIKLDHLTIFVGNCAFSRDWYMRHLGLTLEFEIPERGTVALQDDTGLTLFLHQLDPVPAPSVVMTFQVDDVEAKHAQMQADGVAFVHPPQKVFWGYGAELLDPDGHCIRLWDERTMREKGGS